MKPHNKRLTPERKLIKKQIIAILAVVSLLLAGNAVAGEVIAPLRDKKEVGGFIKRLNSQGKVFSIEENVKEDKVNWADDYSFFMLGDGQGYSLYKADINNDGKGEYILCLSAGSGGWFDIDAIYQDKNGKLVDIFNDIKIPMRKLIRDAEKEKYDLEEGYAGFMNGSIKIEKDNNKIFFTLEQVTRDYGSDDIKYDHPKGYKFLWDKGGIKLVQYYVGDKV